MGVYVSDAILYGLLYQPRAEAKSKDWRGRRKAMLRHRLYSDLLFNPGALGYIVLGLTPLQREAMF
jgi:hypothetical protein